MTPKSVQPSNPSSKRFSRSRKSSHQVRQSTSLLNHPLSPTLIRRRCFNTGTTDNVGLDVVFPWATLWHLQRDFRQGARAPQTSDHPHSNSSRTLHGTGASPKTVWRFIGCLFNHDCCMASRSSRSLLEHEKCQVPVTSWIRRGSECDVGAVHEGLWLFFFLG